MNTTNITFRKAEHTSYDYIFHIAFAVLLCLYSFLILFSTKLLGVLFFISGLFLLGSTVWRGIKTVQSMVVVLLVLCLLFFSRIVWLDAFHVLPVFFYNIFQIVFFIEFAIGIALLYSLTVKTVPLSSRMIGHSVHILYFVTGVLLIPYTWLYSYGAIIQGEFKELFWSILILVLWSLLYYVQLITHHKRTMSAALYAVNIGIGCWAFYRWITIFS